MIKILKLYKREIGIFFLIVLAYFAIRLPNLTLQPIFADEAIYIRWAQIMKAEPTLRFISITDGKTPLFMWMMIPLFKIFHDPLFAGRFLSVLAGFGTLLGAFTLSWKFFGLKTGLWSAFLIAITPYIVFFDRMALVDSMLASFSIWALFLSLLLIQYSRLDLAMLLGYFLGGGLLTKTPGFFNFIVLPISLILFNFRGKDRQWRVIKLFSLWMVAVAIGYLIYSILRLGPEFDKLSGRNQDYIFSPLELVGRPLDPFIPHFNDIVDWFPKLLTLPVLIFMCLGIAFVFIKKNKYGLAILLWGAIPLLIEMALLKTFTARYILFPIPPLLCIGGWAIFNLSRKVKLKKFFTPVMLAILLPLALYFNLFLIRDPSKAPLPNEERGGYLEAWTAGYGFPQIAQYLITEAQNGGAVVGTEGSFGTLPDGLQIYLEKYIHTTSKDKQITVIGGKAAISAQLRQAALEHPTFFVTNKSRYPYYESGLTLIKEYPKAKNSKLPQDAILFFKVSPLKQQSTSPGILR